MSNANTLAPRRQTFSMAISTKGFRDAINNTLQDPARANRFIASITTAVAATPALQTCDNGSILAGALQGEALNLPPSPQLCMFYLVPFKQKAKFDRAGNMISPECSKAQFILGYKGYLQMAIRSGQYKDIGCMDIRQGEYLGKDPATAKPRFRFIEDDEQREALPVVGYMAYFEYLNGFYKSIYWSKEKMLNHADRFSQAFSKDAYAKIQAGQIADKDLWKYSSFWYKDFDSMAMKTLLRQLISKWGIMSTEMQTALVSDGNALHIDKQTGELVQDEPAELAPAEVPVAELEPEPDPQPEVEQKPKKAAAVNLKDL